VWSADANGDILLSESQWQRFTGRPPEPRGLGLARGGASRRSGRSRRQWTQSVERQTLHDFTFRMRRHDGVYRMVRAYAAPLYDENNRLQEWFGTTTDVTGQYEAKAAIEERNLRLSVAMDAANMTIVSLDLPTWSLSWKAVWGPRISARAGRSPTKPRSTMSTLKTELDWTLSLRIYRAAGDGLSI